MSDILVVTASDSAFMPFLDGMLASLAPFRAASGADVACFDIGLNIEDRETMTARGVRLATPDTHFGIDASKHPPALRSFLARPFLPTYFPGYAVYLWIDSDIWLQDPATPAVYVAEARRHGMAVTHEDERAYRFQAWLVAWTAKHFLSGYGPVAGAWLLTRPHVNAGMFAIRADAPHWKAWARRYEAAIARSGHLVPHDQFALNQALHADRPKLDVALLDPVHNWICDRGTPLWDDAAGLFCQPRAPYRPIRAMHLAGPAKRTTYKVRRSAGGSFTTLLVRGAAPGAPVCALPRQHAAPAAA